MSEKLTQEQIAAIDARGKVIVSASAGSGKTFVMIRKLCDLIEAGGDLDGILAVTFTKKAAAQMKEKLRKGLIERLAAAQGDRRAHIKAQLAKVPSADISTIHSFCARLVRTYFYALDVDSAFDIIPADDAQAVTLKYRALDNLFERLYDGDDEHLKLVLECLKRKRSDDSVKALLLEAHNSLRNVADYARKSEEYEALYTPEGFERVCAAYRRDIAGRCADLAEAVDAFEADFAVSSGGEKYKLIFGEMRSSLSAAAEVDLFAPLPPLSTTRRPKTAEGDEAAAEQFADFRTRIKKKYDGLKSDLGSREEEFAAFMESGRLAVAFGRLVLQFDEEYTAVKRDEGKLDYNDLEHLTLRLLRDGDIRSQINGKYGYVFVDEYQDVNPVQDAIIDGIGAENVFTVGDVKQAIYGFRGSKSVFFSRKYEQMKGLNGALRLSSNFRSADKILDFVNALFSDVMTERVCGFTYKGQSEMVRGGKYPQGSGEAVLHVFGKPDGETEEVRGVYSVAERALERTGHTREGLAVLEIVKRELRSTHFDLASGEEVPTQPGDICILTRKRADRSATGIVAALTDAGYQVAGAKEANLCNRSEVRELLDILSLLDNCQQDIPLSTALLSPLGGLTHDELALIRISQQYNKERPNFRECMVEYVKNNDDVTAQKIAAFFKKINTYRRLSDVLGAAQLIDKILSDTGLSARWAAGGGEKLAAVKCVARQAYSPSGELSLHAFLRKLKAGGYNVPADNASGSDCIKVMTMHASKGLEFPVVIVADIAASFKGRDYSDMPFDDELGFSPKCYDVQTKLQRTTLLRRLCSVRAKRENIKNELNLFYVACTRAMCRLHVMCSEAAEYDATNLLSADSYAKLFDVNKYCPAYMPEPTDFEAQNAQQIILAEPDEEAYARVKSLFNRPYAYADSVDLPVKSSASRIIQAEEEEYYVPHTLFDDGGEETGAERGTAYHRYLQLCDFSVRDGAGVSARIEAFVRGGLMPPEQAALLSVDQLVRILAMPAFSRLAGATLYREREFLCRLPANTFLDTSADDPVLVQGAIDLLAVGRGGAAIIDYKYSKKDDGQLVKKYAAQLKLYRQAASAILHVKQSDITLTIVNICACREIGIE